MVNESNKHTFERHMITNICKIFWLHLFDPNTSVVANYSVFANNKHVTLVCRMTLNIRANIWSTEKIIGLLQA